MLLPYVAFSLSGDKFISQDYFKTVVDWGGRNVTFVIMLFVDIFFVTETDICNGMSVQYEEREEREIL